MVFDIFKSVLHLSDIKTIFKLKIIQVVYADWFAGACWLKCAIYAEHIQVRNIWFEEEILVQKTKQKTIYLYIKKTTVVFLKTQLPKVTHLLSFFYYIFYSDPNSIVSSPLNNSRVLFLLKKVALDAVLRITLVNIILIINKW